MQKLLGSSKDLGGFGVTRLLPHAQKRMVGPFVFLDHMGPADFAAGEGIDVRPHPHIGLATLTYLFDGAMLHSDSLGNRLEILPGDVNLMVAGKGIVHSERESIETKALPHRINGLQCWLALPEQLADIDPAFHHYKRDVLPQHNLDGVHARLVIGEAYGMSSPIKSYSTVFFMDILASTGKKITRPNPEQECAAYIISGRVSIADESFGAGDCILLDGHEHVTVEQHCRIVLLGGERWQHLPHLYWNFVSFSKERIEQAKDDWREGRFPSIPGDDLERIPLP